MGSSWSRNHHQVFASLVLWDTSVGMRPAVVWPALLIAVIVSEQLVHNRGLDGPCCKETKEKWCMYVCTCTHMGMCNTGWATGMPTHSYGAEHFLSHSFPNQPSIRCVCCAGWGNHTQLCVQPSSSLGDQPWRGAVYSVGICIAHPHSAPNRCQCQMFRANKPTPQLSRTTV